MASEPTFGWQTSATTGGPASEDEEDENPMSAMEAQSSVVDVLREHVGKSLTSDDIDDILSANGAAVVSCASNDELDGMLRSNKRVRLELSEEGEARYSYIAKFEEVVNYATLKARVEKSDNGIRASELLECYAEAESHIEAMIVAGDVLAVKDASERKIALYGRGDPYVTSLSGAARPSKMEDRALATESDTTLEIRRGDAVAVLDPQTMAPVAWRRVSSRVAAAGRPQPKRAERPLSVSSVDKMHTLNIYVDVHDKLTLPMSEPLGLNLAERALLEDVETPLIVAKHGCTNDVRLMWLETAAATPDDPAQLDRKLVEANLKKNGDQKQQAKRPARRAQRNDGPKPKRRRAFNNFHKLTNVHLIGTDIGNVLAAAANNSDVGGSQSSATGGASFESSAPNNNK